MSTTQEPKTTSFLSPQFISGVYIPSALVILGVGIVKFEWLPFAIVVSLVLGTWKIYSAGQQCLPVKKLLRERERVDVDQYYSPRAGSPARENDGHERTQARRFPEFPSEREDSPLT